MILVNTIRQIICQILQVEAIDAGNIFNSAKTLQKTADAVRVSVTEHRNGLRPFFENIFNNLLSVNDLCVHAPKIQPNPFFLFALAQITKKTRR